MSQNLATDSRSKFETVCGQTTGAEPRSAVPRKPRPHLNIDLTRAQDLTARGAALLDVGDLAAGVVAVENGRPGLDDVRMVFFFDN